MLKQTIPAKILALILTLALSLLLLSSCESEPANQALYEKALKNGKAANEGLQALQGLPGCLAGICGSGKRTDPGESGCRHRPVDPGKLRGRQLPLYGAGIGPHRFCPLPGDHEQDAGNRNCPDLADRAYA